MTTWGLAFNSSSRLTSPIVKGAEILLNPGQIVLIHGKDWETVLVATSLLPAPSSTTISLLAGQKSPIRVILVGIWIVCPVMSVKARVSWGGAAVRSPNCEQKTKAIASTISSR